MSAPKIAPRHPTAAAIDRLGEMLRLPPLEQDWDVVCSDPDRLAEFLDAYEHAVVDDDQRFALMELIVASYDDLLRDRGDADGRTWERLRVHLLGRFDLHGYTVQYWSLPDEGDDPDHLFPLTPWARELMAAVFGPPERWPRQPFVVKRFIAWPDPVVPGVALDAMDISNERDGTFALSWSTFGDRSRGERGGFASVADAVAFAGWAFGVAPERWANV